MTIEAKQEFHRATTKEEREALLEFIKSSPFRIAMIHTTNKLAEMGIGKDEMRGALLFRTELLELAEPEPTPTVYPQKQLKTLQ